MHGRRHGLRLLAALGATSFAAVAVGFGTGTAAAVPASQTFNYSGAEQTYVVPTGVVTVDVTAIGAAGGTGCYDTGVDGGAGAVESAEVAVAGGETLYVEVGGVGGSAITGCGVGTPAGAAGGFNGGAGGGSSGAGGGGGG